MQMFIAVINENFSVVEEAKREMQASDHSKQHTSSRWLSMLNPYLWARTKLTAVNGENLSSTSVLEEEDRYVHHGPLPMPHGMDQVGPSMVSLFFLTVEPFGRNALQRALVAVLVIYERVRSVCFMNSSPGARRRMGFHSSTCHGYVLNQGGQRIQSRTKPIATCEEVSSV